MTSEMGLSLFLVDDDESNRISLSILLEDEGFAVEVASSFAEAQDRLLSDDLHCNFVLLDQRLGDGLGTDLVPTIRSRLPQAKVVLLTGDPTVKSAQADAIIAKGGGFLETLALLMELATGSGS